MKRIVIVVEDDVEIGDLSRLMQAARSVIIEPFTEDEQKKEAPARRITKISGRTIESTLMEHFVAGGEFSLENAEAWITPYGYASNSVRSILSKLVSNGCVVNVARDRYRFVKPALKAVR